jgi:hypothetical protein
VSIRLQICSHNLKGALILLKNDGGFETVFTSADESLTPPPDGWLTVDDGLNGVHDGWPCAAEFIVGPVEAADLVSSPEFADLWIQGFSLPDCDAMQDSRAEEDWDHLREYVSAGLTSIKQEEDVRERNIV